MGEKEQTALACRCHLKFSEGAAGVLEKLRVRPPYSLSAESKIDVLANQKIAKFALLQSSGEPLWTMVRRGNSRATSVWDHQLRAYWDYSEEQIKPVVIAPAGSLQMRVDKTTKEAIATLECEDESLGPVRIELEFADRRDLAQHAPALLWLLFGGRSCHQQSGLPLTQLEKLGCLVAARASVGKAQITELVVDDLRIVDVRDDDFRPPENFTPFDDSAKGSEVPPPIGPVEGVQEIKPPRFPDVPVAQRSSLTAEEALTPDCMGSTRQGAMTFLLHQDALDHATSLINQLAPLLGTATISGGTLSLPWVAALRVLAAPPPPGAAPPPGAGLATLLQVPRGLPAGGTGLFDALSVMMIRNGEERGRSFLQNEAATGALLNIMLGWTSPALTPLPTATISALFATGGDLRPLTSVQRVAIADAHELGGIGTFRLNGLPTESEEASVPGVATGRFLGVTGTVAFGAMPPGFMLFPAMIGTSGEISLGLTPPPVTLTAAAVWRLDPVLVSTTHVVSILGCLLVPLGCAGFATVATGLTTFLANQLTTITARTAGVSFIFELRFEWDQARGVLTPKMRTLSTAGAITVVPTYTSVPNLIRFQIEQLITITGNTLNLWLPMVARVIENAIETGLKQLGCEFPPSIPPPPNRPVSGPNPNAVSGSVRSVENSHLLLDVELSAAQDGVGPFATQAADADAVRRDLQMCHTVMRSDLARPPGNVTIVGAGAYAGMGVNQNALNHYVFAHWRQGDYTIDIRDAADLARIAALAPPGTFVTVLTRVHAWPASCPRVEVAETPLANNGPSLLAFFDDWRICFETLPLHGEADGPGAVPKLELSFNARMDATATVDFPFVPQVLFDMTTIEAADERTWQFVDLNNPLGALTFDPKAWRRVASEITQRVLGRFNAARLIVAPTNLVRNWRRPIPNARQQVFLEPQTLYMELLARRRAIYMLPVLNADWLEFFDNSGAPLTAALLNMAAAPVTSITLTRLTPAQGTMLRGIFTAGMPTAFFIPP